MTVNFLGLTGPAGVLPSFYTAFLRQTERDGDPAASAFLDLFNHRLIALFFRAGEKYRADALADGGETALERCLYALIGLHGAALRGRLSIGDGELLPHAGSLARVVRSAEGLRNILAPVAGAPVEIVPFVARWLALGPDQRSRVGVGGSNNGLGTTLVLGQRVRDEQGQFRVRVGPLALEEFRRLLPGRPMFRALVDRARFFAGVEWTFDVELVLRAEDVPPCRLGRDSPSAQLGRLTWASSRTAGEDARVVFPTH